MKTISDLNAKWWYRFIKVLYSGAFIIAIVASSLLAYKSTSTRYENDVSVHCIYGNKKTFNLLHDEGVPISTYNSFKTVPDELNQQILQTCQITDQDIITAKQKAEFQNILQDNSTFRIKYSDATYTTGPVEVPIPTPWRGVLFIVIDVVGIILLFQVFRRLFYYVVLGSFAPKEA